MNSAKKEYFVENLIAEFHDNAEKGTWRDPHDETVALFPIENIEAWLRTTLLAAVEHGRSGGYKEGALKQAEMDADTAAQARKEGFEQGRKEVAHKTEDGYCCACGFDIADFEERLREAKAPSNLHLTELKRAFEHGKEEGIKLHRSQSAYEAAKEEGRSEMQEKIKTYLDKMEAAYNQGDVELIQSFPHFKTFLASL